MPGRRGTLGGNGQWMGAEGSSLLANLSVSTRSLNTPAEYKATIDIVFVDEFVSGDGDSFEAFVTTDDGGGTGSGSDAESGYRYGFNGKENDDFDLVDFGERFYNPQLGRFLSVDPRAEVNPQSSPYSSAGNNPIIYVDKNGEIPIIPLLLKGATGAGISVIMQFGLGYVSNGQNANGAWNNIDWGEVGLDGLASMNPFKIPGGNWGKAAVYSLGIITNNAVQGKYKGTTNEVLEQVTIDFFVNTLAQVGASKAIEKLGPKIVQLGKFLAQKTNYSSQYIKELTGYSFNRMSSRMFNELATDPDKNKITTGSVNEIKVMLAHLKNNVQESAITRGAANSGDDFIVNGIKYDIKESALSMLSDTRKLAKIVSGLKSGTKYLFDGYNVGELEVPELKRRLLEFKGVTQEMVDKNILVVRDPKLDIMVDKKIQ